MKKTYVRLFFLSIIVGIAAGCLSVVYRFCLSFLEHYRVQFLNSPSAYIVFALLTVVLSLLIGKLLKWQPLSSGSGIPQVTGELNGKFSMDALKIIIAKIAGGLSAGIIGMSLGREGPSIQLGAASAKLVSKADKENAKMLISAGASAGLAAAFNAPISGVLFAIEELHKKINVKLILACLTAAVSADFVSKLFFGYSNAFAYQSIIQFKIENLPHFILLGILTSITGVIFNKTILKAQDSYTVLRIPKAFRPFVAAVFSFMLLLTFPKVLGGGHHLAQSLGAESFPLQTLCLLLIVKLVFTCLCYGSGTQGGIFLPVLVLGAVLANIYFLIFGSIFGEGSKQAFIILGMVGILSSVVRAPLLAIILVFEMTGSAVSLVPLASVSLISYAFAYLLNNPPIYESLLERMSGK